LTVAAAARSRSGETSPRERHLHLPHSYGIIAGSAMERIKIDFDKNGGLVPVITQDADSGEVLMLAHMNEQAFEETLRSGRAVYWSRRRGLWRKGEESGNYQDVRGVYVDCDADTILLKVHQHGGAACHTGRRHCFYRERADDGSWRTILEPVFDPEKVYGVKK
jgi:phosphoribosyl-AMP cyclohydrolase